MILERFGRSVAIAGIILTATAGWSQQAATEITGDDAPSSTAASLRKVLALLEDEIIRARSDREGLLGQIESAEKELEKVSDEIAAMGRQRSADTTRLAELAEARRNLEVQIQSKESQLSDRVTELDEIENRIQAGTEQVSQLEAQIAASGKEAQRLAALKDEATALEGTFETRRARVAELEVEIAELTDSKTEATEALRIAREARATAEADLEKLTSELAAKTAGLSSFDSEIEAQRSGLVAAQAELARSKQEMSAIAQELEGAKAELQATLNKRSAAVAAVASAKAEEQDISARLQAMRSEMTGHEADLAATRSELEKSKRDLEKSAAKKQTAEAELASITGQLTGLRAELETAEKLKQETNSALAAFEAERTQLAAEEADLRAKRKQAGTELNALAAAKADAERATKAAEAEREKALTALADAETNIEKTNTLLDALIAEADGYRAEITELAAVAEHRSKQAAAANETAEEVTALEARKEELAAALRDLQDTIEAGHEEIERVRVEVATLAEERDTVKAEIADLETRREVVAAAALAAADGLTFSAAMGTDVPTASVSDTFTLAGADAEVTYRDEMAKLASELEVLREQADEAALRLGFLTEQLEDGESEARDAAPLQGEDKPALPASSARIATRPVADARALLRGAPGLADADPTRVEQLATQIANGVCPTDALRSVFGAINRQTLVYLMKSVGAC